MKKSDSGVLSICYCMGIVFVLIFLYGCSGTTHTISTEQVPIAGSETIVEEWELVENPNTGIKEMQRVRRVRTTSTTTSSHSTESREHAENKGQHYPSNAHDDHETLITTLIITNFVVAVIGLCMAVSE